MFRQQFFPTFNMVDKVHRFPRNFNFTVYGVSVGYLRIRKMPIVELLDKRAEKEFSLAVDWADKGTFYVGIGMESRWKHKSRADTRLVQR